MHTTLLAKAAAVESQATELSAMDGSFELSAMDGGFEDRSGLQESWSASVTIQLNYAAIMDDRITHSA